MIDTGKGQAVFRYILFFCVFFCQLSSGKEIWRPLGVGGWTGGEVKDGRILLDENYVYQLLDIAKVRGKWVKVAFETDINNPDFTIKIYTMKENSDGKGYEDQMYPVPTLCSQSDVSKICSSYAWIRPDVENVRVSFWSWSEDVIYVSPGHIEVADMQPASERSKKRYAELLKKLRALYYLSSEADWNQVISAGEKALSSPPDLDPIPVAINELIRNLPDSSHMRLYPLGQSNEDNDSQSVNRWTMPKCKKLNDSGVYLLSLPGTPNVQSLGDKYVSAARSCIADGSASRWIIDLTENAGGDANLMFAALSDVFGEGPLLKYVNSANEEFVVSIGYNEVTVGGEKTIALKGPVNRVDKEFVFLIDRTCASSCEAVAASAKRQFPVIGQDTQGMTTVNESIRINEHFVLPVTSGFMESLSGSRIESVSPDIYLTSGQLDVLRRDGVFPGDS